MADPIRRVTAVEIHLSAGVSGVAGEFKMPAGHISLSQDGPQIFQPQLAAVTECPEVRLREIRKIRLRIELTGTASSIAVG